MSRSSPRSPSMMSSHDNIITRTSGRAPARLWSVPYRVAPTLSQNGYARTRPSRRPPLPTGRGNGGVRGGAGGRSRMAAEERWRMPAKGEWEDGESRCSAIDSPACVPSYAHPNPPTTHPPPGPQPAHPDFTPTHPHRTHPLQPTPARPTPPIAPHPSHPSLIAGKRSLHR